MNEKILTVFTPTYNRAYILPQAYESLRNQTSLDFIWLIIDDGSTDETEILVRRWIEDGYIDIIYEQKQNGGMHTAHNRAFALAETELLFCMDSDDNLYPGAIEGILRAWKSRNEEVAGVLGNEHWRNQRTVIGNDLPDIESATFRDCYYRYNSSGDKVVVLSKKLYKNFRYPEYEGEKLYPLGDFYFMIKEPFIITHELLMEKEYLEDGATKSSVIGRHISSPNGFADSHYHRFQNVDKCSVLVKSGIQYIALSILSKRNIFQKDNKRKGWTILLFPAGFLWFLILLTMSKLKYVQ